MDVVQHMLAQNEAFTSRRVLKGTQNSKIRNPPAQRVGPPRSCATHSAHMFRGLYDIGLLLLPEGSVNIAKRHRCFPLCPFVPLSASNQSCYLLTRLDLEGLPVTGADRTV